MKGPVLVKPTATQTSYEDRVRMVELRKQGWTDRAIAEHIGCRVWTVIRWVKAFEHEGWEALAYKCPVPPKPLIPSQRPKPFAGGFGRSNKRIRNGEPVGFAGSSCWEGFRMFPRR